MLNSKAKVKRENKFKILKPEREVETEWQYIGLYTTHHHQESRELWPSAQNDQPCFKAGELSTKNVTPMPITSKAHSGSGEIERRGKNVLCAYFPWNKQKQNPNPL